jgi:UDP-glucose 4-epimerase
MAIAGSRPTIYGDGMQSRDFVYVTDVAAANVLAATTAGVAGQIFNVARGGRTTLLELIEQLTRLLDRPLDPIFEAARLGDVRESQADITQARLRLGFDPRVDIAQGLRTSIDYYRQQATGKG